MGSYFTTQNTVDSDPFFQFDVKCDDIPQIAVKIQMEYILCHWIRKHKMSQFPPHVIKSIIDRCIFDTIFDIEHQLRLKHKDEPKPQILSNHNAIKSVERYDYLFKVILIGDSGVGKSSLLTKYVDDVFQESNIQSIGIDFKVKTINIDNKTIKLQIWEIKNGQEKFRTITTAYYRGTHGIIIVYDVSDQESFDNIKHWNQESTKNAKWHVRKMLIGNKTDLNKYGKDVISGQDKLENLCEELKIHHCYQTSAKTGENVNNAFSEMANGLYTYYMKRTFMPWYD